ncbi:hypothetical protein [Aquimarina sp. AU58]|uniref:hypothetical protein n=1 Tax=Aquimarina sp. AU58 TaxID=1874112 RepID=UPI001357D92D|nr:hypothetical protein [Aquimarina sp. AU58]
MIDYTSNISLTPEDNNRFQSIYASQSYGTFYAVFARFTVHDIITSDHQVVPNKKLLEQIELKLVNYKGNINMAFAKKSEIDEDSLEKTTSGNEIKTFLLKINIKGAVGDNIGLIDVLYFEEPLIIENDTYFTVIRELLTLSGKTKEEFNKPEENSPFVNHIFDEEFYLRDGENMERKKEDSSFFNHNINNTNFKTLIDLNWPGKICVRGSSKIKTI